MREKLNNPGENKGSSNSKVSKGKEDIPDPQDVAVPLWAALAQPSRTMATIRSMMAAPQSAQAAHVMGDMKSQSNEKRKLVRGVEVTLATRHTPQMMTSSKDHSK